MRIFSARETPIYLEAEAFGHRQIPASRDPGEGWQEHTNFFVKAFFSLDV